MPKYIIGLDLGGTVAKIGLFNERAKLLSQAKLITGKHKSRNALIDAICSGIENLIKKSGLKKANILAIGMGVPGPVNAKNGLIYYFPNIPGWKNTKAKQIFENKLKIPVFLENDVNLMALAEYKCGAGRGAKNMLCITLGTGVGGGLILDGKVFRGTDLVAGEVGHMPIVQNGQKCGCGARGCLEAYVGNKNILKIAAKEFGKNITLEELSKKALKGNAKAIKIWRSTGEKIGMVLAGILNLLNLEKIVIGGGVANAGKFLFSSINETIQKSAMPVPRKNVKILKAKLGYDAGLIGSAIYSKERSARGF